MKPIALISPLALAACAPPVPVAEDFIPEYLGAESKLLGEDLVQVNVAMTKARVPANVQRYATCAVAQFALTQGYGFARHLRTNVTEEGGVWAADAVYTISPTLPDGLATIDAEVTVAACKETGIPTV
ncbi:hypothetical protein ACOTTU_02320 [Roseobacter sp. EG26]|uniref:hypothetical protein n=1 Tax=Roseobacter sp. EG26 TaxID=3412477 RepID=UPI00261FE37A|nr:hypothetical protein [uncultured Roseobacter sp.]